MSVASVHNMSRGMDYVTIAACYITDRCGQWSHSYSKRSKQEMIWKTQWINMLRLECDMLCEDSQSVGRVQRISRVFLKLV